MTRTPHIVPAALAFLAAVFVTDAAMAQCPSGTYQCGADYCTPDGAVCCSNVGLPQYYCPSGTSCQSDGSCESGASSSVSSSSSSSSTTGGDGGCPYGSYSCGADYCTPDGAVCCANVGWPEYYCPGGSVCLEDGSCGPGSSSSNVSSSSSSGTTGGSDSCPSGSYSCGADYCTPDGAVCCASVGWPEYYCPGGSVCLEDGSCGPGSTTSSSSSNSSNSSTNGDTTSSTSTGGGGTSGTGTSGSAPPQVEGCSSYFDHGYDEYQVEVQCQSAYIYACAGHQEGITASCDILDGWGYGSREACPYCTGTDPREDSGPSSSKKSSSGGGCALSPSGSPVGEGFSLLALLGFGAALRRRRAKPAVRA